VIGAVLLCAFPRRGPRRKTKICPARRRGDQEQRAQTDTKNEKSHVVRHSGQTPSSTIPSPAFPDSSHISARVSVTIACAIVFMACRVRESLWERPVCGTFVIVYTIIFTHVNEKMAAWDRGGLMREQMDRVTTTHRQG
jgi:hypothetical protein